MENVPILEILLFIVGLGALIKGGNWFVDGATGIAHRFHVPELVIGATVVSIGTTLPEVMVSTTSALRGVSSMAYGNAVGSVICNTALIAALTVAVRPSRVDRKTLAAPVGFFFATAILFSAVAVTTGFFSRTVGVILLLTFAAYVSYVAWNEGRNQDAAESSLGADAEADADVRGEEYRLGDKSRLLGIELPRTAIHCIFLVVGAVLIACGATLLVNNGTVIATWLGVPDSVIALTFIALGTSLPELTTAVTALVKGHSSLSLGNIIGANILNLALVSGTAITICPFPVPTDSVIGGVNASLAVDLPVMLVSMAILTLPALVRGRLSRWQGVLLLALYAVFCVLQFV